MAMLYSVFSVALSLTDHAIAKPASHAQRKHSVQLSIVAVVWPERACLICILFWHSAPNSARHMLIGASQSSAVQVASQRREFSLWTVLYLWHYWEPQGMFT